VAVPSGSERVQDLTDYNDSPPSELADEPPSVKFRHRVAVRQREEPRCCPEWENGSGRDKEAKQATAGEGEDVLDQLALGDDFGGGDETLKCPGLSLRSVRHASYICRQTSDESVQVGAGARWSPFTGGH